ncbi:MAG: PAS domain S-box protein [Methylococcales bacterium]|nr:PAS domain S-box protein [Methylococcales bacterium]MBT7409730.1 PAS domain S-box protein [Methylococcales bacterium]
MTQKHHSVSSYQSIINSINFFSVASVLTDMSGNIKHVNKHFSDIFQYTSEELINQNISILIPIALRHNHSKHRNK